MQATVGTAMAALTYYQRGLITLDIIYKGFFSGLLGAILGSLANIVLADEILRKVVPILLVIMLIYTVLSPKFGFKNTYPKMGDNLFYPIFGFLLGFYDGFFGPGTGSLWIFSLVFFLGYNITESVAYTKIFNLKSNLVGSLCFGLCGSINYKVAIIMAIGQIVGGKIGAHLAIKGGAKFIYFIFILVVIFTIIVIFYKNYIGKLH